MDEVPKREAFAWQGKGEDCNQILIEATHEYLKSCAMHWLMWDETNPVQNFDRQSYKSGISAGASQLIIDIFRQEDFVPTYDDDQSIHEYIGKHRKERWEEGMPIFNATHRESFLWGVLIAVLQVTKDINDGYMTIEVTLEKRK
jgi:hypothetical protein